MTKRDTPLKGHQPYKLARALDILQSRRIGVTFAELALRHGVTATRIQQIYWQAVRRTKRSKGPCMLIPIFS